MPSRPVRISSFLVLNPLISEIKVLPRKSTRFLSGSGFVLFTIALIGITKTAFFGFSINRVVGLIVANFNNVLLPGGLAGLPGLLLAGEPGDGGLGGPVKLGIDLGEPPVIDFGPGLLGEGTTLGLRPKLAVNFEEKDETERLGDLVFIIGLEILVGDLSDIIGERGDFFTIDLIGELTGDILDIADCGESSFVA